MNTRSSVTLFAVAAIAGTSCAVDALADGPVWRRDPWDRRSVWSPNAKVLAFELDSQGGLHVATAVWGETRYAALDAAGSAVHLSPPLGDSIRGRSIVRDAATGDVALLTEAGFTVTSIDSFGAQKWSQALFPASITTAGALLQQAGDVIAWGDDQASLGYRAARVSFAGQVAWTRSVAGLSPLMNIGAAMAPTGQLVVAGFASGARDAVLLDWLDAATGTVVDRWTIPLSAWSCPPASVTVTDLSSLAVDAAGACYLAGTGNTVSGPRGLVLKVDAGGTAAWCHVNAADAGGYYWSDEWFAVAAGPGGIAVTGYAADSFASDMMVAMIDAGGQAMWAEWGGGGFWDMGLTVAFDAQGNVLVGGYVDDYHPEPRMLLARYRVDGTPLGSSTWANNWRTTVDGVAVDAGGDVVAAGRGSRSISGLPPEEHPFVARYRANGDPVWTVLGSTPDVSLRRIVLDASGAIYAAGAAAGAAPWCVQKYASSGAMSWEALGSYPVPATDLALLPSGELLVAGSTGRLVWYDALGVETSTMDLGGLGARVSLAVHDDGAVTAAGAGIVHLSPALSTVWQVPQVWQAGDAVEKVLVDDSGDLVVGGSAPAAGGGTSFSVARIASADGRPRWLSSHANAGASQDRALSVAVEPSGDVVAVGSVDGHNRIVRYRAWGVVVSDKAFILPGPYPSELRDVAVAGSAAIMGGAGGDGFTQGLLLKWELDPASGSRPARIAAAEGPGPMATPVVRSFGPDGVLTGSFVAYGATGYGANVAVGDIDAVGRDENLTGAGPGAIYGPHVRAFSASGVPLAKVSYYAYATLHYGANVAQGNLDADSYREILAGPGPGAVFGPHVRGFGYDGVRVTALPGLSYFAYGSLRFGVNVGSGDLDGDGVSEPVTGAGPGASFVSHVRGWSYGGTAVAPVVSFQAFPAGRYGVTVASSDLDANGLDELLAGAGPDPTLGCEVRAFDVDSGAARPKGPPVIVDPGTLYGANVGGGDLDLDGADELLGAVGDDPAGPARVRAYRWVGSWSAGAPDFVVTSTGGFGANVAAGVLD